MLFWEEVFSWNFGGPQKSVPRSKVPKGSVGLAGKKLEFTLKIRQGWNIIGNVQYHVQTVKKWKSLFCNVGDKIILFYSMAIPPTQK